MPQGLRRQTCATARPTAAAAEELRLISSEPAEHVSSLGPQVTISRVTSQPVTRQERMNVKQLPIQQLRPVSDAVTSTHSSETIHPDSEALAICFMKVTASCTSCGTETTVTTWPQNLEGFERLRQSLIQDGFLPDPALFHKEHPEGYGGKSLVFAFEQTALDPSAEPLRKLYVCVGPWNAGECLTLLCLVSKVPLFEIQLKELERLRDVADDAVFGQHVECLLGSSASWAVAQLPGTAGRSLPRSATAGAAEWALGQLLEEFPWMLGGDLVTLLSLVLQERSLLLVGEPRVTNAVALLLYALLPPYEWMHLFLPATLPREWSAKREDGFRVEEVFLPMLATAPQPPATSARSRELCVVQLSPAGLALDAPELKAQRPRGCSCVSRPGDEAHVPMPPSHRRCARALARAAAMYKADPQRRLLAVSSCHEELRSLVFALVQRLQRHMRSQLRARRRVQALGTSSIVEAFLRYELPSRRRFYRAHLGTQMASNLMHQEMQNLHATSRVSGSAGS